MIARFSLLSVLMLVFSTSSVAETSFTASNIADVMECAHSDRVNLDFLKNLNDTPSKEQKKLAKRLAKLDVFLEALSESEVAAGKTEVDARRLERKEKRKTMTAIEIAVSASRSKPPCDSAVKIAKEAKG